MKTNSKEFNKLAFDYLLNAIDCEGYDLNPLPSTDREKLQHVANCFFNEVYKWQINKNVQDVLMEWFMGLPSCINIDFENYKIIEIAKKWGSLPENATERQEDKIIENWFNLIAFKLIQLWHKNNVHFTF